jgi:hypothetical protein
VKTDRSSLAVLVCVAGLACTGTNPAYRFESPQPASDRPGNKTPDANRPRDVADAGAPTSDSAADVPLTVDAAADQAADAPPDAADADGPADAAPDSPLPAGLVVRYPLDLVASVAVTDLTGTQAGAMHGGAGWTNLGFPEAQFANGGALVLDGTSGYVTLPASGLPNVSASKSIAFWFWQSAPINNLRKTMLAVSNPAQAVGLNIGLQAGVPSVWFWGQLIGTAIVACDESSPAGWTHLAFVQQGITHRLYIDGTLVDSVALPLPNGPVTSFTLGGYVDAQGEHELWNGRLDDVRLYNRALTAAEIKALAAGAP